MKARIELKPPLGRTLLILCALALSVACALPRAAKRAFTPYRGSPACARQTLERHFGGLYPKAQFTMVGATVCVTSNSVPQLIYCPDPPYRDCEDK